jgi:hypothetical protein
MEDEAPNFEICEAVFLEEGIWRSDGEGLILWAWSEIDWKDVSLFSVVEMKCKFVKIIWSLFY